MCKSIDFNAAAGNCLAKLLDLHRAAIQLGIYSRSGKVALLIGTVLNLINQPQAVLGLLSLDYPAIQRLDVVKALLTYSVPFLVASYGAITAVVHKQTDS